MTFGTYAPRAPVHPDRYGVEKTKGPNLWLVLHTSEGGESTGSPEQLISFMQQPGDRDGPSGPYGASYQCVTDTDCLRPAVSNDVVSYSAGGGNAQGVHLCFPGKAGQTREQWLDDNSRAMIRRAAEWCVDQGLAENIPMTRISVSDVKTKQVRGICDHYDISRAFKLSDHTDVGAGFPWDILFADIAKLTAPQPPLEPFDMDILFRLKGKADVVKIVNNVPMPLSRHALDIELKLGTPNPYGIKSSSTANQQNPIESPAPYHEQTEKWLENQLGYQLSDSPV